MQDSNIILQQNSTSLTSDHKWANIPKSILLKNQIRENTTMLIRLAQLRPLTQYRSPRLLFASNTIYLNCRSICEYFPACSGSIGLHIVWIRIYTCHWTYECSWTHLNAQQFIGCYMKPTPKIDVFECWSNFIFC